MTGAATHGVRTELDGEPSDPSIAFGREWLQAHGDGSFAFGTVAGALTRRYHGVLVAELGAPHGRTVLVSKIDDVLVVAGRSYRASANVFADATHDGVETVREFALDPFPTWRLEVGGVVLERVVFVVRGEPTTVVRWRHLGGAPCMLELRPLCALRPFHQLVTGPNLEDYEVGSEPGAVVVRRRGLPAVRIAHEGQAEIAPAVWWGFRLPMEEARGLDSREDLCCPGVVRVPLEAGRETAVVVTLFNRFASEAPELERTERARREALVRPFDDVDPDARRLVLAADAYRADRGGRRTVIAGYPWFEDWGRDTMIAMPGLLAVLGRREDAQRLLESWADELVGGLLPNRFPDGATMPDRGTVDASLLFVEAVRVHVAYGGALAPVLERLYPVVLEIVMRFAGGTFHGIGMDDDGLVRASAPGRALTWMDAIVYGRAVTPRRGKPVEIQALWHAALCFAADLAVAHGAKILGNDLRALARKVEASFRARFWDEQRGYCADVVDPEEPAWEGGPSGPGTVDARLAPNQLFAIALGRGLLRARESESVIDAVQARLLTPRGLRTLAPGEHGYQGRYDGGPESRDTAYHRGTAWPWLLGPYARALVVTRGSIDAARVEVRAALEPLLRYGLREGCLGQLAEVYDGDAPHRPGGCPAQAWSVSEVLRAWLEIVEARAPVGRAPAEDLKFTPATLITFSDD